MAIAASGKSNSGVEIFVSICLFGLMFPSPKSKKVCQPMKRLGARKPPRRSSGSGLFSCAGSKIIPKKGWPLRLVKFARYDGRTML